MFNQSVIIHGRMVTEDEVNMLMEQYSDIVTGISFCIKNYYMRNGISAYYTQLNLPLYYVEIYNHDCDFIDVDDDNRVYLPCISTELGVLSYLMEHPNNSLFRLLEYFNNQINLLRSIDDDIRSASYITSELLESKRVLDVFGLHRYEYLIQDSCRNIKTLQGGLSDAHIGG